MGAAGSRPRKNTASCCGSGWRCSCLLATRCPLGLRHRGGDADAGHCWRPAPSRCLPRKLGSMRFSGAGGFIARLLVVVATIGLAALDVGTDLRSPQLDSVIVAGDLPGDRRISAAPAVTDTISERRAPDRPSHPLLVMVVGGVFGALVFWRGFLRRNPETPRIRVTQHSSRRVRAPPQVGLSF